MGRSGGVGGEWGVLRLLIPAVVGVLLLAGPAAFAVFPGLTSWSRNTRLELSLLWVLVAVIGGVATDYVDHKLATAVYQDQQAAIRAEHRASLREQFSGMLVPGVGGLPSDGLRTNTESKVSDSYIPGIPRLLGFGDFPDRSRCDRQGLE
jgi:hypothetical protein